MSSLARIESNIREICAGRIEDQEHVFQNLIEHLKYQDNDGTTGSIWERVIINISSNTLDMWNLLFESKFQQQATQLLENAISCIDPASKVLRVVDIIKKSEQDIIGPTSEVIFMSFHLV